MTEVDPDGLESVTIPGTPPGYYGGLYSAPKAPPRGDPDKGSPGVRKPKPPAPPPAPAPAAPPADITPFEPTVETIDAEVSIQAGPKAAPIATVTPITGITLGEFPFLGGAPAPAPAPSPRRRPRRRPPPKKPAPRRSPRRTSPPPRIPIEAPALRFGIGRLLGVVALLPLFGQLLTQLDKQSQDTWNERLFGAPGDDKQNDADGRLAAPQGSAGRYAQPAGELESVTITSRPPVRRPVGAPSSLLAPTLLPIGAFEPGLPEVRRALPRPTRAPRPRPRPQPRVNYEPLPSPFPSSPGPLPRPGLRPSPQPTPFSPSAPGAPSLPSAGPGLGSPLAPIIGTITPVPDIGPVPVEQLDRCKCPKPKTRKPRKQRTECFAGTYTERASGTSKRKRTRVDCATGAKLSDIGAGPKPVRSSKPKPRRRKGVANPPPTSWEVPGV